MDHKIEQLYNQFKKIKKLEYLKSTNQGFTSVNSTFNYYLKKANLEIPNNLTIKVKRSYSKALVTLFNLTPTGPTKKDIARLNSLYGTKNILYPNQQKLKLTVTASTPVIGVCTPFLLAQYAVLILLVHSTYRYFGATPALYSWSDILPIFL